MYAIINWMDTITYSDLSFVLEDDGSVMLFEEKEDCEAYAREELNGKWRIVRL